MKGQGWWVYYPSWGNPLCFLSKSGRVLKYKHWTGSVTIQGCPFDHVLLKLWRISQWMEILGLTLWRDYVTASLHTSEASPEGVEICVQWKRSPGWPSQPAAAVNLTTKFSPQNFNYWNKSHLLIWETEKTFNRKISSISLTACDIILYIKHTAYVLLF